MMRLILMELFSVRGRWWGLALMNVGVAAQTNDQCSVEDEVCYSLYIGLHIPSLKINASI